ncbi:hypothetical protein [Mycobacteroides abscessus]|uniref:hypothetical protein n=1 Tax=Mycobacteroides abscessus TaxID=36809 RepID=UPI0018964B5E
MSNDLEPWNQRLDEQAVAFPAHVTPEWVSKLDRQPAGLEFLRAHLVARESDREYDARWRRYWQALVFDRRRRSRTLRRLHEWREEAEEALASTNLDGQERGRAEAFHADVVTAIARVQSLAQTEALAWAGQTYAAWPMRMRQVAETMAVAIDEYLEGRLSREELAAVRTAIGLQPGRQSDIPEQTRVSVRELARTHLDKSPPSH